LCLLVLCNRRWRDVIPARLTRLARSRVIPLCRSCWRFTRRHGFHPGIPHGGYVDDLFLPRPSGGMLRAAPAQEKAVFSGRSSGVPIALGKLGERRCAGGIPAVVNQEVHGAELFDRVLHDLANASGPSPASIPVKRTSAAQPGVAVSIGRRPPEATMSAPAPPGPLQFLPSRCVATCHERRVARTSEKRSGWLIGVSGVGTGSISLVSGCRRQGLRMKDSARARAHVTRPRR